MKIPKRILSFIIVYILLSQNVYAQKVRHYQEITITPSAQKQWQHPPITKNTQAGSPHTDFINEDVSWSTPLSWDELQGSGMRVASFKSKKNPNAIDCSIISLGGEAGGIKSNVLRWMRQIGMNTLSDKDLEQYLNTQKTFQTKSQHQGILIDLSQLQDNESQGSMIASIITTEKSVVFVKMTGSKNNVLNNKHDFLELCKSLQIKE